MFKLPPFFSVVQVNTSKKIWAKNLPVANFSTISGIRLGHFSGKSHLPIIETASENWRCIASGDFSIRDTMSVLMVARSDMWILSVPSSSCHGQNFHIIWVDIFKTIKLSGLATIMEHVCSKELPYLYKQ